MGVIVLFEYWNGTSLVELNRVLALRISGLIVLTLGVGIQSLFATFFVAIFQTNQK